MSKRILTTGCIINDGVEFQMDEEKSTYTWKGRTILGHGIYKITRADDGVGKTEVLYDVKERTLDAFVRFESIERLVKAGAWRPN